MEAHICNHPMVPHTVEWRTGVKGAPSSRELADLERADAFAKKIIRQDPDGLQSLRIYRSDNRLNVCFRWDGSQNQSDDKVNVKMEVDMEPLKEAFDNVAQGFSDQDKAIKELRVFSGLLTLGLIGSNVVWFFVR